MTLLFKIGQNHLSPVNTTKRAIPKIGDIIDVKHTVNGVVIPKRLATRVRITDIEDTRNCGTLFLAEALA